MEDEYKKAAELADKIKNLIKTEGSNYVEHQLALSFCIIDMAYFSGVDKKTLQHDLSVTVDLEYNFLDNKQHLIVVPKPHSSLSN